MKKVICIDNKIKTDKGIGNVYLSLIKEGGEYEVEFEVGRSYKLVGIDILREHIGIVSSPYPTFLQERFIPLSDISETQMGREFNSLKELV